MGKAGLRQLWFQIHKWIGIILAIVLIPLSLTGSLLVWDESLDRALNPKRHEVTGPAVLSAGAYLATAMKALPAGAHVASMTMPEEGAPVLVSAAPAASATPAPPGPPQRIGVWLDPATGNLLDIGPAANPVIRFFHQFHGNLFVPGVGRSIVGWLGVLMSISCFTGIWLWWPMIGKLARAFRWRRQPQFDTNLHHMVGFWISIPLALLSVTGVLISFPSLTGGGQRPGGGEAQRAGAGGAAAGSARGGRAEARGGEDGRANRDGQARQRNGDGGARAGERGNQAAGGAPAPAARRGFASPPLATTNLTIDRVIAASGIATAPYTVTWPTEAEASWRVATTGETRRTMMVEDATGEAKAPPAGAGGQGQRSLTRRLHDGTGMGLVFQTVIFLGGIAPAALGITGITMWLRTRRWRGEVARKTRARRQAASAAAE